MAVNFQPFTLANLSSFWQGSSIGGADTRATGARGAERDKKWLRISLGYLEQKVRNLKTNLK